MNSKKEAHPVSQVEIEGLGLITPGVKVKQPVLGRGVVEEIALWADGTYTIRVNFKRGGPKWLHPGHARLKRSSW
jgi:hypothetical protein